MSKGPLLLCLPALMGIISAASLAALAARTKRRSSPFKNSGYVSGARKHIHFWLHIPVRQLLPI